MLKKAFYFWVLFVVFSSSYSVAAPRFTVDSLNKDVGKIPSGCKRNIVYEISNTGDDTLEVSVGQIPCACLVSTEKRLSIAPGKTVLFEVSFNSHDYAGKVSKEIPILTSDNNNRIVKLGFKAFVYDLFAPTNKRQYLGEILAGEQTKTSIEIVSQYIDPSGVKLILPDTNDPNRLSVRIKKRMTSKLYIDPSGVKLILPDTNDPNRLSVRIKKRMTSKLEEETKKACVVELSIGVPVRLGKILDEVTLVAEDPNSNTTVTKKVQFGAIIVDPHISKYELPFGVIFLGQSKKSLEKEFVLTSIVGPDNIRLIHIPKHVKVERTPMEKGDIKFRVILETDGIKKSGLIEDVLTLSYSSSGKKCVRSIPVSAMIIAGGS